MDKKKFDPDDLQVIKAKIDLYKATIESLKKEHLAYQEILSEHGHYQKKKEVIPLNKFHNKDEHMENEYYEEEEYMESEYYDEEEHLESEYQDEDYMENEQLEANHYFTEQFDYLHGYLNELGQELLSLNKKIVLILKKQDQLLKNNGLKEIKEEIASLKKSLQPKETPAPPATKAPQGFSQLRNMVQSNSHVYDPNEQSRFQGLGNYPSPPRNYPSNPTQQGTPKGRRPLSPSKKSKTVKSNKLNSPKQRTTSSPKPPKSEGTTIKRKDEPDANLQKASVEINQRPPESAVTDFTQVQQEILTNAQVKNKNMSRPKLLETESPSVVKTDSISNEKPISIKEDVTAQPTPVKTEPEGVINTNPTPNKEPLPVQEEGTAQPTPAKAESEGVINTNSTPNKEPLPVQEEGTAQPTPAKAESEGVINTNSTPNKEPLPAQEEGTIDSPVSQPETVHVENEGIGGNHHLPVKEEKVIEPSSPETRLINVPNEELEVNEKPIIENLEEPKKNKEMNLEEKKIEKSFEGTTKNVETQRKPPVNSFFLPFSKRMKDIHFMVPFTIFQEMIAHCHSYLPFEGCGLLSGVGNQVRHIWTLHNEAESNKSFYVSKQHVEEAINHAVRKNDRILAVFHSHPTTSALPSSYDLLQHADPEVHMVIVSFKRETPEVKCYQIVNKRPTLIPVSILTD